MNGFPFLALLARRCSRVIFQHLRTRFDADVPIHHLPAAAIPGDPVLGQALLRQVRGYRALTSLPRGLAVTCAGIVFTGVGLLIVGAAALNWRAADGRENLDLLFMTLFGLALGFRWLFTGLRRVVWSNTKETVTAYSRGVRREMKRLLGRTTAREIPERDFASIAFRAGQASPHPRRWPRLTVTAGRHRVDIVAPSGDPDLLATLRSLWCGRMAEGILRQLERNQPFPWQPGTTVHAAGIDARRRSYRWSALAGVRLSSGASRYVVASSEGTTVIQGRTSDPNFWPVYLAIQRLAAPDAQRARPNEEPRKESGSERRQPPPPPAGSPDLQRVKDLATLGLDEPAAPIAIHSAFRRLAQIHHPDRFTTLGPEAVQAAQQAFIMIRAAFDRLMAAQAQLR